MIRLEIGNSWTKVQCETEQEAAELKLTVSIKHSLFTKLNGYESRIKSYYTQNGWLPTGLVFRVVDHFGKANLELADHRTKSYQEIAFVYSGWELKRHQQRAVDVCIKKQRGIISHPTGSGKTVTFSNLICKLRKPTMVIVPNRLLLNQTYKTLSEFVIGGTVGRCGDGLFEIDRDVVISTAAMLYSRLENSVELPQLRKRFGVLIVDECHHIDEYAHSVGYSRNSWYEMSLMFDAYYRFAYSGTVPETGLRRFAIEAVTGGILDSITSEDCISLGIISGVRILMKSLPKIPERTYWETAQTEYITERVERNIAIAELAQSYFATGKSVLVFVNRIAHGELLREMISDSIFVHGDSTQEERDQAISFMLAKSKIVIGTIFGEGFDMPNLDVAINAAAGKSDVRIIQQVGRVLRNHEGKSEGILIDFQDRDKGGVLSKHTNMRIKLYEQHFGQVFELA